MFIANFEQGTGWGAHRRAKHSRAASQFLALIIALGSSPGSAMAQPDPLAEQGRQSQRERDLLQQLQPQQDSRIPDVVPNEQSTLKLPANESPCFAIDVLVVQSASGTEAELNWLRSRADKTLRGDVDPVEGKCLGVLGISQVVARLQDSLASEGFITARVIAESQDLKQGRLVLTWVPGHVADIRMADAKTSSRPLWTAATMKTGDRLQLRAIEHMLETLRRTPSSDANVRIEPGTKENESDLVIDFRSTRRLRGEVSADDSASKATGRYVGGLLIAYDNPLDLNDMVYVYLSRALRTGYVREKGTRSSLLHYSIPYGYWTFTATHGENAYRQTIAGAFSNYSYRGSGSHTQLGVSRALWRNARHRLSASGRLFQRRARNFIDDVEVEVQRRATAGWDVGMTHRAWWGAAVIDATLTYKRGTGAFHAIAATEQDFGEGTSRFKVWNADLNVALPFQLGHQRFTYTALLRGQSHRSPLAPQERFLIGGRYSVRGFDGEVTLAGDRGLLARNELAWSLFGQQVYAGVDWGEVGGQASKSLAGQSLAGAVIGLRGASRRWSYDLFVGRPISRPEGFRTGRRVAGFSTNVTF